MVALFASQLLFHRGFKAGAAHIVAAAVLRVRFQIIGIDLGDVAQKVASGIERIVPDAPHLGAETREQILLLGEFDICLDAHLLEEGLGLESYPAAVLVVVLHLFPYEIHARVQRVGKSYGVQGSHFPWRHEDVVTH